MFNIALHVEYNGSAYHGFQRQKDLPSIQESLEQALSQVADHPVIIHCAGRTDAGVHATAQVVSFNTQADRDLRAWTLGVNQYLPPDIAIRNVVIMPDDFHARYSAISRTYRYVINNHALRRGLWQDLATHYPMHLDVDLMQQGAAFLIGEHDFSAFRGADCQSKSPVRTVEFCHIHRDRDWVFVDIQANAFLHHMVRNIVGSLAAVGKGLESPAWIQEVLKGLDRREAAMMMPAQGLYLVGVTYPEPFQKASSQVKMCIG
jgi:tRNA pseudouridine38-40 synthase